MQELEIRNLESGTYLCVELPISDYREVLDLQHNLVAAKKEKIINAGIILLLEHTCVFTLGRRGGLKNLKVSQAFLEKSGVPVIQVERGGNITFHGPGQLVVYPIIDLREVRMSVVDYVTCLEEVMIRAAADWGIEAERNLMNRGIWVENNKLGSIGIALRRGVSFHGFALNVNLSLKPFSWIKPCGLQGIGITSMERELSHKVPMDRVREAVKRHIKAVFEIKLTMTGLPELQRTIDDVPVKKDFLQVIANLGI